MAAFSPVTFLQPELYAAVSSPSPRGPGMGGIPATLEEDPGYFQPGLAPLLPKFSSPASPGALAELQGQRRDGTSVDMAWVCRQSAWAHVLALLILSCVTLRKPSNLPEPLSPHR